MVCCDPVEEPAPVPVACNKQHVCAHSLCEARRPHRPINGLCEQPCRDRDGVEGATCEPLGTIQDSPDALWYQVFPGTEPEPGDYIQNETGRRWRYLSNPAASGPHTPLASTEDLMVTITHLTGSHDGFSLSDQADWGAAIIKRAAAKFAFETRLEEARRRAGNDEGR